jgi:hypothetical protein
MPNEGVEKFFLSVMPLTSGVHKTTPPVTPNLNWAFTLAHKKMAANSTIILFFI